MRFLRAAWVVAAVLPAPAAAAPANLEEQYRSAAETFLAGADDVSGYVKTYPARLMDGISGKWALMIGAGSGEGFKQYMDQACRRIPATIVTRSELSFVLTRESADGAHRFDAVYTVMVGNMFGQYVDPGPYLDFMAIPATGMEDVRATMLRDLNGIATIVRPSPDILVIQTNYGVPKIYARC